ncbi:hypothetical protein [Rhodococcus sp. NBC_00297]|uniref:hypothetical protein n=1 Tax=Rhodococcus sp. NBC_00297 TaxID=2976005 RepID=UPI002E2A2D39|nr:hypothetical protein [Rhodococcus sp. NBC_00297]
MRRRLSTAVVLVAVLSTFVATVVRTSSTDAAWVGREHLATTVTPGYWPTSGSAYAEAGRVVSASGLVFNLLSGGTSMPWSGVTASRTQTVPGASTASNAGPYRNGGVLGLVNQLISRGVTDTSPIVGDTCASYAWGPGSPPQCTGAAQKVYATSTLSTYTLRAELLAGLGSVQVVTLPSAVTATASCNFSTSTASTTATGARAANATAGDQGTISIRNQAVAIPAAGGTTAFDRPTGVLVPRLAGTITSAVTQSAGQARSTLTVDGTLTYIGLVPITFRLVVVDAMCGKDVAAPVVASAEPAARVAVPEAFSTTPAAPSTTPEAATSTAGTTTTTSAETATTAATTTSTTASTTTTTVTTAPTPTITIAPTPDTTDNPLTTTAITASTTTASTTTSVTPAATEFSGPPDGSVTRLVTSDGLTCVAGTPTEDAVPFACGDGSAVVFTPVALSPPGIAAATTDGLWSPRTLTGETVPVEAATRS